MADTARKIRPKPEPASAAIPLRIVVEGPPELVAALLDAAQAADLGVDLG